MMKKWLLKNIKSRVQNSYPIYEQNGWKTIPFGAAHTYIAHIREYTPPPLSYTRGLLKGFSCYYLLLRLFWVCLQLNWLWMSLSFYLLHFSLLVHVVAQHIGSVEISSCLSVCLSVCLFIRGHHFIISAQLVFPFSLNVFITLYRLFVVKRSGVHLKLGFLWRRPDI